MDITITKREYNRLKLLEKYIKYQFGEHDLNIYYCHDCCAIYASDNLKTGFKCFIDCIRMSLCEYCDKTLCDRHIVYIIAIDGPGVCCRKCLPKAKKYGSEEIASDNTV
jgi:hypothetical protein